MALTLTYTDSYLKSLITEDLETRAAADVAEWGVFAAPWPDKLTVLRAYVLCCLESNAAEDDAFSVKLKQYQREFDAALKQARLAASVPTPGYWPLSIPLERG